jgi:hypothetical protein
MPKPAQETIDHYVRAFEEFRALSPYLGDTLSWTVVRSAAGDLTVAEVVRRLGADPDSLTMVRPFDDDRFEHAVYIEQRGDAVILVATSGPGQEDDLAALSRCAVVHSLVWLVNAYNRLLYAITGLDVLFPTTAWGADPAALDEHLGALVELEARQRSEVDPGPFHDWETAMATLESLTGVRLTAEWFARPQSRALIYR